LRISGLTTGTTIRKEVAFQNFVCCPIHGLRHTFATAGAGSDSTITLRYPVNSSTCATGDTFRWFANPTGCALIALCGSSCLTSFEGVFEAFPGVANSVCDASGYAPTTVSSELVGNFSASSRTCRAAPSTIATCKIWIEHGASAFDLVGH
jgi:hypothetical protein